MDGAYAAIRDFVQRPEPQAAAWQPLVEGGTPKGRTRGAGRRWRSTALIWARSAPPAGDIAVPCVGLANGFRSSSFHKAERVKRVDPDALA